VPDTLDARLARILEYMRHYYPDDAYRISFFRVNDDWQFVVSGETNVRAIKSETQKLPVYAQVTGPDFDKLPEALFEACRKRVRVSVEQARNLLEERSKKFEEAASLLASQLDAEAAYLRLQCSLERTDA
jgi:hypothetical protein